MNNPILRIVSVTQDYQPLSAETLIASATISCPPANIGEVFFKGDDGSHVPWQAGEWHSFQSVDLSEILIKGTLGDTVTVVGGTW